MTEVAHLVAGVEYKVGKLIGAYQQLRRDYTRRVQEAAELAKVVAAQEATIRELEEKLTIIRITKTIETKEGTVEAKLKINELVREIDKCIGLLNA